MLLKYEYMFSFIISQVKVFRVSKCVEIYSVVDKEESDLTYIVFLVSNVRIVYKINNNDDFCR